MKVSKEKGEENALVLKLEGEEHSFPNAMRELLWEDKNVDFAAYTVEHPKLVPPKLIVRMKKGDPEKAVIEAAKTLEKMSGDFKKLISKEKKGKKSD